MVEVGVVPLQRLLSMHCMIEIFMGLAALNLVRVIMSEVVLINMVFGSRSHVVVVRFR